MFSLRCTLRAHHHLTHPQPFGLPQFLGPEDMGYVGGWTETLSSEGTSDKEIIALVESHLAESGHEK